MRNPCTATKSRPRSPQEKAHAQQQRPNTAKKFFKINKFIKKKKEKQHHTWVRRTSNTLHRESGNNSEGKE